MLLQRLGIDEQLHSQIPPYRRFALRLRKPSHRVEVVRLDPIEIVFGLGINGPENRIGVRLAVDVRDPPVIADDRDITSPLPPSLKISVLPKRGYAETELNRNRENEKQYRFFH